MTERRIVVVGRWCRRLLCGHYLYGTGSAAPDSVAPGLCAPSRRLIEITSHQQQTQRTLLEWLRAEYAIEKPSIKLLAVTDLDSDTWVGEVKHIRGKKLPLTAAGVHALRDEYTRTIEPALALAAETLTLERKLKAEG